MLYTLHRALAMKYNTKTVMHQANNPAHSIQQLLGHDSISCIIIHIRSSKQLDMNMKTLAYMQKNTMIYGKNAVYLQIRYRYYP